MNKYNKGKIYKIVDNTNGNVYYGSTIQTLKERLRIHKSRLNCSSRDIIANEDYEIILIENYPCESKKELELRERYFIENNECINNKIPGRTQKEYRQDNRDIIQKISKEYHENNKDKINQQKKEYYENNKDKIRQRQNNFNFKQYHYLKTWGGDKRFNNNLLMIDIDIFLST
jgi:hypothetical protein